MIGGLIAALLTGSSYAFDVHPPSGNIDPTASVVAAGVAHATLVPFDVDFIAQPGYTDEETFNKFSNNVWDADVHVYDNQNDFGSVPSLSWRVGKGPGRPNATLSAPWNACVISLPFLFDVLDIQEVSDGSCFDVVNNECLYSIILEATAKFGGLISQASPVTSDVVHDACKTASSLNLVDKCFKQSPFPASRNIHGYAAVNPHNGQPLLLGLDKYDAKNKSSVKTAALSRVWPMLVMESQGTYVVQGTLTCPSASMNNAVSNATTPSPDGTCGGLLGYGCTDTKYFYGKCCGPEGYCGYSSNECSLGCQGKFGLCDDVVVITSIESSFTTTTTTAPGYTPPTTQSATTTTSSSTTTTATKITTTTSAATPTGAIFRDGFSGDLSHWNLHGGFAIQSAALHGSSSPGGLAAVKNVQASDVRVASKVNLTSANSGDAGVILRVSDGTSGQYSYFGYYAGISMDGYVILGRESHGWKEIKRAHLPISANTYHTIVVDAIGDAISVTVDDAPAPQIQVRDSSFGSGSAGVRLYQTNAIFDDFSILPLIGEDFESGTYNRWTTYGSKFDASSHALVVGSGYGSKALLNNANFTSLTYELDVTLGADGSSDSNAGIIFGVSNAKDGTDSYDGYYFGISIAGYAVIGRAQHNWNELKRVKMSFQAGTTYRLKVLSQAGLHFIYVDDMHTSKTFVIDRTFQGGQVGVRVYKTSATFDNIKVAYM